MKMKSLEKKMSVYNNTTSLMRITMNPIIAVRYIRCNTILSSDIAEVTHVTNVRSDYARAVVQ